MRPSLLAVPLLAVVACSSSSSDGGPAPGPITTFTARFELPTSGAPDLLSMPFPNDLLLAADGTIAVHAGTSDAPRDLDRIVPSGKGAGFVADALGRTRGFGVYAGAIFEIQGDSVDPRGSGGAGVKLPTGAAGDCTTKDAAVFLFDLDDKKAIECRADFNDDNAFGEQMNDGDPLAKTLVVRTARGVVLPEGHHVAVLLTYRIVSTTGKALNASTAFAAIRDGDRADATKKTYGDAIDLAAATVGFDTSIVVDAAVYTTGHPTHDLRDAREAARAAALPTLHWDAAATAPVTPARFTATTPLPSGWNASLDDYLGTPSKLSDGTDDPAFDDGAGIAHDAIAALGTAEFDAPNLLQDKVSYADADHGTLYRDASGNVEVNPAKPTAKIWVTFAVPKGAMPANGWPVMVFQHGLGGQRGDMLVLANTYAHHGWATASIEAVLSGTRAADAPGRGDSKSDYHRSGSNYAGADGFSDRSSDGSNALPNDLFGDLYRIASMRDQFIESAVDHTTLLRLLQSSPTLDGLADAGVTPKLDGTKVAYSGDSLGGIIGALTAGVEPNHAAYILNVPGGGMFTELGPSSPGIYQLLVAATGLFFGYDHTQFPAGHPLLTLFQHVMDGGDPIADAPTVSAPIAIAGVTPKARNVLLFEAIADEVVPNEANEALAKAMGIPVVSPHVTPLFATLGEVDGSAGVHDVPVAGSTGALVQVSPATHGSDFYEKNGERQYAWPTALFGDPSQSPFPRLATPVPVSEPYLALQAAATAFITDAFAGKAPTLTWTTVPIPPQ